jgi:hypothetical protein
MEASHSSTDQTFPGTQTTSYSMGTRSLMGVKGTGSLMGVKGTGSLMGVNQPGRGVNHPHPSRADVKERVDLCLYSPSVFSDHVIE